MVSRLVILRMSLGRRRWSDLKDEFGAEALEKLELMDPASLKTSKIQKQKVEGVGRVECWVDACSVDADMGHVRFWRLLDVVDGEGVPVVLEEDYGEGLLFYGRNYTL